jgi:hypothetical protein
MNSEKELLHVYQDLQRRYAALQDKHIALQEKLLESGQRQEILPTPDVSRRLPGKAVIISFSKGFSKGEAHV